MQIVVLIGFIIALTFAELEPSPRSWAWVLPALIVYVGGSATFAWGRGRRAARLLAGARGPTRSNIRQVNLMTLAGHVWLLAGLAGVLGLGLAGWITRRWHLDSVPLAAVLVALAPFLLSVVLTWLLDHPLHVAARRRVARLAGPDAPAPSVWNRRDYVLYNIRHTLLFIAVPICLILLISDSLRLYVGPHLPADWRDPVLLGATMTTAAGVFLVSPILMVRVWRTRRLDDGPLRAELEGICRQMELTYREILVWRTGGVVTNAAVIGLVGPARYVLLSDALLENMHPRHVRAVFAHEAGHIAAHHMPYAVIFVISATLLSAWVSEAIAGLLGLSTWSLDLIALALMGAALGVGFGRVSRRFERHSDVIGAWAAAPPAEDDPLRITPEGSAIYAQALQQVARLNGMPPSQPNWRHGSIADRVSYILWLGGTRGSRRDADRSVQRVKRGIWAAALLAAALTARQFLHS